MLYKVRPPCCTDAWVVEVSDKEEGKGKLSLAAFSGPSAKEQAIEYIVFMLNNGHVVQRAAAAWIQEDTPPVSNEATPGLVSLTRLATGGEVQRTRNSQLLRGKLRIAPPSLCDP